MDAIRTQNLTREYSPDKGALNINITVEAGDCFGLLGSNGSGKSTLTRLILGLEKPDSGILLVLGHDLSKGSKHHLRKIGYTLDTCVHWDDLTGYENAYFISKKYGMDGAFQEKRLRDLFEMADLWDRAMDPVKTYSFGMRKKLSIIQALCHEPELLLLDEPTIGLDSHFSLILTDLIKQRTRQDLTTWISGNDPDWVSGLTNKLAFIDSGQISVIGDESSLINELSPFQKIELTLLNHINIDPPKTDSVISFDQTGKQLTIILKKDPMLIPFILESIVFQHGSVSSLEVHQGTLRDAFLFKTGRTLEA